MILQERAAEILRRIRDRFTIRPEDMLQQFQLVPAVIPITDLDKILQDPIIIPLVTALDPGALGWYSCPVTPPGKRYTIEYIEVSCSAATTKVNGVSLTDPDGNAITLYSGSEAQALYYAFTHSVVLNESWLFSIYVSTYQALDTMNVIVYGKVEDTYSS